MPKAVVAETLNPESGYGFCPVRSLNKSTTPSQVIQFIVHTTTISLHSLNTFLHLVTWFPLDLALLF
jgi:hypothetical protein